MRTTITQRGETITTLTEEKQDAGDWRAACLLMARRSPREMGDRSTVEVSGAEVAPEHVVTTEEVWEELEALRRQRLARQYGRRTRHHDLPQARTDK